MNNHQSPYTRTGELRSLIRQRNLFLAQPRDEKRYWYPVEIDVEHMIGTDFPGGRSCTHDQLSTQ